MQTPLSSPASHTLPVEHNGLDFKVLETGLDSLLSDELPRMGSEEMNPSDELASTTMRDQDLSSVSVFQSNSSLSFSMAVNNTFCNLNDISDQYVLSNANIQNSTIVLLLMLKLIVVGGRGQCWGRGQRWGRVQCWG